MKVKIKEEIFKCEFLNTPEQIQKGMMGKSELDGCMVFNVGYGPHVFWMKDCLIPLDIIFTNKGIITSIHRDCQPCEGECIEKFKGVGDRVLEFPSGTSNNWTVGDRFFFINE